MKKTMKKIFNVIIDILIVLVVLVSAIIATLSITSKSSGVPSIFGITIQSVQSESMEPVFNKGDVIFGNVPDEDIEFKIGDIVTFPYVINDENVTVTHRIVEIEKTETDTLYYTQGDNEETNSVLDDGYRLKRNILSYYSGGRLAGFGGALDFLRTQLGFFLVIGIPMILFFIYEAFRVVKNLIAYNKEKALAEAEAEFESKQLEEKSNALSEDEKKAIAEAYLAKQEASEILKEEEEKPAET